MTIPSGFSATSQITIHIKKLHIHEEIVLSTTLDKIKLKRKSIYKFITKKITVKLIG